MNHTENIPAATRRNVAFTSMVGTLVEFYDFAIYGVAAALVFPSVFFPALSSSAGVLASFATFGVAFVARPVGGALFGHFGDRLGRKRTLVTTLVMMGVATAGVGLLPTPALIGPAAPVVLVVLRIVQGLAAGGEWAGANLFVTEYAPKDRRGFWATFPQLGANLSFPLANATFLATGLGMDNDTFTAYGWRIPFLTSAVLVAVGLYVRLRIDETPVFRREVARNGAAWMPLFEAFRHQAREIALAAGVGLTPFAFFYVSGTYLTNYAHGELGLSRTFVLTAGTVSGLVLALGGLVGAALSDRFGRRVVIGGASITAAVWALALFPVISGASGPAFMLALCVTMLLSGIQFAPMGAFLPEQFHTRYRYTASAVSYNLGTVVGGSVSPLIAPSMTESFGASAFGIYLSALCLLAAACTFGLRETRTADLEQVAVEQGDPDPDENAYI
ncbi:MFS transporter [Streptomyces sp. NPDC048410]|uniref:MFS transporter n=1 Tax=Streptomyces sp. NPDC048410 TaxID=3365545 RepID=UPI00371432DB